MSGGEARADLHGERRRLGRRQRSPPRDELGERLAVDVLHRDEGASVVGADIEDAHDVRVGEPSRQARLTDEAAPQVLVAREVLGEPLQRHRPVELDVVSEVDGRHRSVAERTDELVASRHARCHAHP